MQVAVRGKNVQVRLNGMLLVDYTEPVPPVIPEGNEAGRFLDRGTFALQCHDAGSKARFRNIRVRPLPDNVARRYARAGGRRNVPQDRSPWAGATFRWSITTSHLKGGLTLEQTLAKSRRDGIQYGIAVNCGKGLSGGKRRGRAGLLRNREGPACVHRHAGRGTGVDADVFAQRGRRCSTTSSPTR